MVNEDVSLQELSKTQRGAECSCTHRLDISMRNFKFMKVGFAGCRFGNLLGEEVQPPGGGEGER